MKDNNMQYRRCPRARPALAFLISLLWGPVVFGADLPTREITSNKIYGLAGHGDTLWMVTDQGMNYTIASSDTLSWFGYKAPFRVLSFSFGAQNVVASLDTTNVLMPNKLWFYNHTDHSFDSLQLPFARSVQFSAELADSAVLMATGVAFGGSDSAFWLACQNGGLARFHPNSKTLRAFFPGINRSFDPASVRIDSVTGSTTISGLASKRIIAVAVQKVSKDTTAVLALTQTTLYRFFPKDSSWDSLPAKLDGPDKFDRYNAVFASDHSPYLFADISIQGGSESSLFRYNPSTGTWARFDARVSGAVTALTVGPDSVTYLLKNNEIRKFSGNAYDSLKSSQFDTRMFNAMGDNPSTLNDILYLPKNDSAGSLWIGASSVQNSTQNGLFFSRFEEIDEQSKTPFVYVRRDRKIKSKLKETYAVPGILSSNLSGSTGTSQTVFAYSLSKASDVTISIYDWNMNLVKNVIVNQPRPAGENDPLGNGRSTNRKTDSWDGTNSAGKRVAVGVYYFKITAKNGERSFGKIIVAK
jgi:hypothetical protein